MRDTSLIQRSLDALQTLGLAEGDIRVRLEAAVQHWIPIRPQDLDNDLADRWKTLENKLTAVQDRHRGSLQATIYQFSVEAAQESAREFSELCVGAIWRQSREG